MMTACNEKDRYPFSFNGQEKVDEIAGLGNHTTALFWEYGTRLGRRWNIDPVVKPWRSPYDAFDNSPISRIDPNGADDYYNMKGKYIGSDGKGSALRLVNNKYIQDAASFDKALNIFGESKAKSSTREISFQDGGKQYKNMMRDAEMDGKERIGYLFLDAKKAEVGFFRSDKVGKEMEAPLDFKAGDYDDIGRLILGNVHTHQVEDKYLKMGFSDDDLFDSQYMDSNPNASSSSDGEASRQVGNIYSIGKKNVNYYSPQGKRKSSNNISSRDDLESSKFNIGQHALEEYGGKPKQNNVPLWIFMGLLSSFLAFGCREKSTNNKPKTSIETISEGKIIYKFTPDLTQFIVDSIMNPNFCMTVLYSRISFDENTGYTTIGFTYDDTSSSVDDRYLLKNTNRFMAIDTMLIPIIFLEDKRFGLFSRNVEITEAVILNHKYNFASLVIDNNQNIVKCLNFLLCNDKPVARPYYGLGYDEYRKLMK